MLQLFAPIDPGSALANSVLLPTTLSQLYLLPEDIRTVKLEALHECSPIQPLIRISIETKLIGAHISKRIRRETIDLR